MSLHGSVKGDEESDIDEVQEDDDYQDQAQLSAEQDEVKVQFDKDIITMDQLLVLHAANTNKSEKLQQQQKEEQKSFIDDRESRWKDLGRLTSEKRNFLHHLAYCGRKTGKDTSRLIAKIILRLVRTKAIGMLDSSKRAPLTVAIHEKNWAFINAACISVRPDDRKKMGQHLILECQSAKNTPDQKGLTCLQSAILHLSPSSENQARSIINMVEFVPQEMFTITDTMGRTPLHLAVEFSRAIGKQPEVVERLLLRGSKALEVKMLDTSGTSGLTVYQYHEKTRKDAEIKDRMPPPALVSRRDLPQGEKKDEKGTEPRKDRPDTRKTDQTGQMKGKTRSSAPTGGQTTGQPSNRRDSMVETPTGRQEALNPLHLNTRLEAEANKASTTSPVAQQASAKPHQVGVDHAEEKRRRNEELRKEREANAEKIGELLKLAYLRNMRPHEASRFLHVADKTDKELWFDFGTGPHTGMTLEAFKGHFTQFQHLEFDKVLQYVAFPRIQIDLGSNQADMQFQGSRHLLYFFQWLQRKGVQRIIKVEVDDMPSRTPAHSDEVIEEALKPFGVEILDWRRPDLCPLMISRIGANLRQLTLQWSGSNPVLRSWGETEGFALTPSLRKIEIQHTQERTKSNLDEFEARLGKSWTLKNPKTTKPDFVRPDFGGLLHQSIQLGRDRGSTIAQPAPERHVDPHKWMQCMENFAAAFRQIKDIHEKQKDPLLSPVTVALIDDGADITLPELQVRPSQRDRAHKSFPGKSFDDFQEGWRISPYWESSGGHGTLMARLIHKICPSADIYVIKLKTQSTAKPNKLQIEPESAIQAINHAADRGVQIISMSWALKEPEDQADKAAFDTAVRRARDKGIHMFCSASDQGNFADYTYPYLSNPGSVFRIGAATKDGTVPDFGHNPHTGSSVATALAAGLAAIVMECVRLGAYHHMMQNIRTPGYITREDVTKIREKRAMEEAFNSITVNRVGNSKYVEVWETFTLPADNLKKRDGVHTDQLDIIAGLASSFLRKGVTGY
ncbi:hypothetical protein VSDG_05534 [Cytospora chrysosperma]|uniref:Peptidase S8/S53 domain-containing protein n=1 Tax=Cytospora chrysosperma TaxID=252740 RepID=A0A423W0E2_CYTCH|nr:hypothetical protein VSDG_05534 [Valsa sordida]